MSIQPSDDTGPKAGPKATWPASLGSHGAAATDCAQKFFFSHCEHLETPGVSIDLHCGSVVSTALEAARREPHHDQKQLAAARQAIASWDNYRTFSNETKDLTNTVSAILAYLDYYSPDPVQVYESRTGPAVEYTFAIPLPVLSPVTGEPILYVGRMDWLGFDTRTRELCVVDEKTTGRSFSPKWLNSFRMRGQLLGYLWAVRQYGLPVTCVLIRGICIQKTKISFQEVRLHFPEWQIDDWFQNLCRKLERMKMFWKTGQWPRSYGDLCTTYGGCPYLDLCTISDPTRYYPLYTRKPLNHLDARAAAAPATRGAPANATA